MLNQKGAAHLLLLLAAVGLIGYILVSSTASFKSKLFSRLYPKSSSFASAPLEFVNSDGQVISSTTTTNTKLKVSYTANTGVGTTGALGVSAVGNVGVGATGRFVQVSYPNDGQVLQAGSVERVTWQSNDVDT